MTKDSDNNALLLQFPKELAVKISCSDSAVRSWLEFDFSWFVTSDSCQPDFSVEVHIADNSTPKMPPLIETEHSPTCVTYDDGSTRYIDYYGRALIIMNYKTNSAQLFSADPIFAYEKLYLMILSRVGEFLDKKGLHRVHALGFSYDGQGVLVLLPMRGGKSTLALSLLKQKGVKLLSEDTPLIDSKGDLYPFPVRIAVLAGESPKDIPKEMVRNFKREQFSEKTLISAQYFAEKIQQESVPVSLVIRGRWTTSAESALRPLGKFSIFKALLRDCVFGLGLPQVVEIFLQKGPFATLRLSLIAARRILASFFLAWRSSGFEFLLTSSTEQNLEKILDLLQNQASTTTSR